jgi:hypothetical protein
MQAISILLLMVGALACCFLYNIQHILRGIWRDIGEVKNAGKLEELLKETEKRTVARGY